MLQLFRLGLEQDELKNIMQDILEMDLNNDWEVITIYFMLNFLHGIMLKMVNVKFAGTGFGFVFSATEANQ